jgi:hypothetical protein
MKPGRREGECENPSAGGLKLQTGDRAGRAGAAQGRAMGF